MAMALEHARLEIPLETALKLGDKLIGVDRFLLEDAEEDSQMGKFSLARVDSLLPGPRENWVEIGFYYEDQTYFSEEENKWEYCSQDDILFVNREDLEEARRDTAKTSSSETSSSETSSSETSSSESEAPPKFSVGDRVELHFFGSDRRR